MLPQRKQRVRQLLLRKPEEKIRLVLGQIRRPLQNPAPALRVVFVHRVVAGGDALRADAARRLQQLVELEMVVAERAGNRRASRADTRPQTAAPHRARTAPPGSPRNKECPGPRPRAAHRTHRRASSSGPAFGASGMPCLPASRV